MVFSFNWFFSTSYYNTQLALHMTFRICEQSCCLVINSLINLKGVNQCLILNSSVKTNTLVIDNIAKILSQRYLTCTLHLYFKLRKQITIGWNQQSKSSYLFQWFKEISRHSSCKKTYRRIVKGDKYTWGRKLLYWDYYQNTEIASVYFLQISSILYLLWSLELLWNLWVLSIINSVHQCILWLKQMKFPQILKKTCNLNWITLEIK